MKTLKILILFVNVLLLVGCNESEEPIVDQPIFVTINPSFETISFGSDLLNIKYKVSAEDGIKSLNFHVNQDTTIDFTLISEDVLSDVSRSIEGNLSISWQELISLGCFVGRNELVLEVIDLDSDQDTDTLELTIEESIDNPVIISDLPDQIPLYTSASNDFIELSYKVVGLDGIADFSASINDAELIDLTEFTNDDLTPFPDSIAGILTLPKELFPTMPIEKSSGKTIVKFLATDQNNSKDSLIMEVIEIRSIRGDIHKDTTFTNDFIHQLDTRVTVNPGVILTIEAGTVIKGNTGEGNARTGLMIPEGAKLIAQGTEEMPIIFTSILDQITPEDVRNGNFQSPNLDPTIHGLWGGLHIQGNASISVESNWEEWIFECVGDDGRLVFGGKENSDDSGILSHISIRHAGASLCGDTPQSHPLILAGVGSGTIVENIEIVASQHNSLFIFGGTVNIKNIVIWNSNGNALTTGFSYAGSIDNFILINPKERALAFGGPEGNYQGAGHQISSGYVYMDRSNAGYFETENADAKVSEVYFTGFNESTGFESQYFENGTFTASHLQMDNQFTEGLSNTSITVAEYFPDMAGKVDENGNPVMITVEPGTQTVGPKNAVDFEWTWAHKSNKLAEIGLE